MIGSITEIATCYVDPEQADVFKAAMPRLAEIFAKASGYRGFSLLEIEDDPSEFVMQVRWESIHHHRDLFRGSPAFTEMVDLLGGFFTKPARLQYSREVFSTDDAE